MQTLVGVWSRLQQQVPDSIAVFVLDAYDPAIAKACSSAAGAGRTVLAVDRSRSLARKFNALWLPRAYVLDERGKVAYVQPPSTPDAHAPIEVGRLLKGTRLANADPGH